MLDPEVATKPEVRNIKDRTIAENKTFTVGAYYLGFGHDTTSGIERAYLKYDNLPVITSSDVIVEAELQMYKPETSYNGDTVVEVHKVLDTWESETITWDSQFDENGNNILVDPMIEDYAVVFDIGDYKFDVTDIVREWYAGENTGLMFKAPDAVENAGGSSWKRFYSSDIGTRDYVPTLTIKFKNTTGYEDYWDYTTASAGRAGTGYVNTFSGNLTWTRSDIGFGGNRMPVSISHVYNTSEANTNNFGMGYGWRTNFNQRVYQWSQDSNFYVWEDGDGTQQYFKRAYAGASTYYGEDGLKMTLKTSGLPRLKVGEETIQAKYGIYDKQGNALYFDATGRFFAQQNNQQTKSTITVTYTDTTNFKIASITDGAGRKYNFTYESNLLSKISYTGTKSQEIANVSFAYSSNNLTGITDMDGNSCTYDYYNNHILKTAQDIDGYQIVYSYYNNASATESYKPVRVQKVQEKYKTGNNSWTAKGYQEIVYADKQATITDHNDNVQVRMFNDFGNLRSVQDNEGRAQYYKYLVNNTGETGNANQLSLSSKLQYTVTNALLNGGFEEASAAEWSVDTTQASATFAVSTEYAYLGSQSLKVTGSTGLGQLIGPSITIQPGETYTLSAYMKQGNQKADLRFCQASDHAGLMYSSPPASMGTGWDRHQVTYTNSTTSPVTVCVGIGFRDNVTFYVDCLQLEKAEAASRYNLVIDGDFRYGASEWTRSDNSNVAVHDTESDLAAPQLDSNAIQITGTPLEQRSISQEIPISGEEGDTFVIAGWSKGESVALTENEDYPRQYGIVGTFHYTDGTTKDFVAQFNPNMSTANKWQYASDVMVAEKAYSSITVKAAYDHNLNTALFDGIQLYKEEFGNSYTYDDDGNVTSVKDLQKQITTYEYSNNNLVKEILPSGAELSYTYDDYHNVIEAKSTTNVTYKFTYDTYGNNTAVYIPHADGSVGIESEATYANNGNTLASTTDALGNVTQYVYDADTNVLKSVKYPNDEANDPNTTARDGNETYYDYDEMFRTEKVFSTTDSNLALSAIYTYGENNDLLTQIKTPSTDYNFDYNTYGLRSGVRVDSQNLATYTYTATNFYLEQLAYSNGDRVQYTYDTKGRLTQQRYEDNTYVSYKYNNSGALARTYDSARGIKTTYFYDLTDRLVGYVEADIPGNFEHSVGYTYDDINNLTALVERINGSTYTTSYTYDTDNRITSVTNGNASKSYAYDSYGRAWTLTTKHESNTVKTDTFGFMPRGTANQTSSQIQTHTVNIGGTNTEYIYTYDANGNITSITGGGNTITYAYDSANQLIREDNLAGDYTHTWTYDNAGNILTRTEYDYASAETDPSGTGETVTYTYGDNNWGDLLTGYNGKTISYDKVGNPESDGTWNYTWQHGRQLARMESQSNSGTYWNFTYNADGLRTKRTNGTKTYEYIYNGSQLTQMTVDGKTLTFSYDASGTPLSVNYNGTTYYYVTNIQGDITAILTSSGTKVVSYTYDAWGNPLTTTGGLASTLGEHNPLRYRGYVYDQETGLYYLQSRYYNPEIGRFINADAFATTGQGLLGNNMFAYCLNNPVNFSDPTGLCTSTAYAPWLAPTITVIDCGDWHCPYSSALSPFERLENHYTKEAELEREIIDHQTDIIISIINSDGFSATTKLGKAGLGIKDIVTGVLLLIAPVPTPADDVVGVRKITFGIVKAIRGIAEFIGEVID